MKIPSLILRQLYTFGSLRNHDEGFRFSLKNRLSDVTVTGIVALKIGGRAVPLETIVVDLDDGDSVAASHYTESRPLAFPLRRVAHLRSRSGALAGGTHDIHLTLDVKPFGTLDIKVTDTLSAETVAVTKQIPYAKDDANYTPEIIRQRQKFVEDFTGAKLDHVTRYSFEALRTKGNIENFTGVAQVPIGFAGPLLVNGEHAKGEFLIPLATTEGTLVASYSRGMKLLNLAGGVTCTVSDDKMQRAPVFIFDSAREARDFRHWVDAQMADIRREAEATSSVAKLLYIDTYLANKFAYLRFNYSTGDAAGQNMVGRATFAACSWISGYRSGPTSPSASAF